MQHFYIYRKISRCGSLIAILVKTLKGREKSLLSLLHAVVLLRILGRGLVENLEIPELTLQTKDQKAMETGWD